MRTDVGIGRIGPYRPHRKRPQSDHRDRAFRKPVRPGEPEDPRIGSIRTFLRKPGSPTPFPYAVACSARRHGRHRRGNDLPKNERRRETLRSSLSTERRTSRSSMGAGACLCRKTPGLSTDPEGRAGHGLQSRRALLSDSNVRANRIFGFRPVEQILLTVNAALRRDMFNLEYHNSGTVPEGLGTLPKDWTTDQVRSFQDYFDALMSGDLRDLRRLRFMPAECQFQRVRQPPLKDQYDEWLARVICAALSIPVSPFVSVTSTGRPRRRSISPQAKKDSNRPRLGEGHFRRHHPKLSRPRRS